MKRLFLALSTSLLLVACGGAADADLDESVESAEEDVTARPRDLSAAARDTAAAVLGVANTSLNASNPATIATSKAFRTFLDKGGSLVKVTKQDLPNGDTKHVLESLVLLGGDVVTGNVVLTILEKRVSFGFGTVPSYSATVAEKVAPIAGTDLGTDAHLALLALLGVSREALNAIHGTPNGGQFIKFLQKDSGLTGATIKGTATAKTRQYTFDAITLQGGDIVVGNAKMTIAEKRVPAVFGFGTVPQYTVTTSVKTF